MFIGRRTDGPEHIDETHVWQMPQGGIDDGEKPYPAALRELYEETSIKSVEKLGEIRDWLTYDIPKKIGSKAWKGKYRGQKQKWYALRFTGKDSEIDIENPGGGHDPEFVDWRWEPMENLPELVVPFKRETYERVVKAFSKFANDGVRVPRPGNKGASPDAIESPAQNSRSVHRGALQVLIQRLEVVEPGDRACRARSPAPSP